MGTVLVLVVCGAACVVIGFVMGRTLLSAPKDPDSMFAPLQDRLPHRTMSDVQYRVVCVDGADGGTWRSLTLLDALNHAGDLDECCTWCDGPHRVQRCSWEFVSGQGL